MLNSISKRKPFGIAMALWVMGVLSFLAYQPSSFAGGDDKRDVRFNPNDDQAAEDDKRDVCFNPNDDQAAELIKRYTIGFGLKHESLAKKLLLTDAKTVSNVMRGIDNNDTDDVAEVYLRVAYERNKLNALIGEKCGREMLLLMLVALAQDDTTWSEDKVIDDVMRRLKSRNASNRPNNDAAKQRARNVLKKREAAVELLEQNMETKDLGKHLLDGKNNLLTLAVLDEVDEGIRDDISFQIMDQLNNEDLAILAKDDDGRALLGRMVQEMSTINTTTRERKEMKRAMRGITTVMLNDLEADGKLEVEVLNFLSGNAVVDVMGKMVPGGAKAHTALVVGGQVYSFEIGGWKAGYTRAEYLALPNNSKRHAVGQVLDMKYEDARKILQGLNSSVGEGSYAVSGDICSDSACKALLRGLPDLKMTAEWNGMKFAGDLHEQVVITQQNFYPKN